MKKYIKWLTLLCTILVGLNTVQVSAEEHNHDHDHEESDSFSADHHHDHGSNYASFIPEKILNPDDSEYEAPAETEEYVGVYRAEVAIEELGLNLQLVLNIEEDGLFNLAYYFENEAENSGIRFYVSEDNEVEAIPATYQDLNVLTGALREGEGGLGTGLIGETIAPVILLNTQGEPSELFAYKMMAYGLREQYVNARVYQSVGLFLADDVVAVDVNHLIGLDSQEQIVAQFEEVSDLGAEQFLVEDHVFELLQHNFDTHLIEHNDFDMAYESVNEFVQKVLAMHLETNASFPQGTEVALIDAASVELPEEFGASELQYAMVINDTILYVHDGTHLYMANEFELNDGRYTASDWITN